MKKVFILIIILLIIMSINVFAYDIPGHVLDRYDLITSSYKYLGTNGTHYFIYYSDYPILNLYGSSYITILNGNQQELRSFYISTNGTDWNTQKGLSLTENLTSLISNHDIYSAEKVGTTYQSTGSVFFSLPEEPFLPAKMSTSIVSTVVAQSKIILVTSVAIMILMMIVILIPRVLYQLF